ncbi:MAG: T9SS type A sorting domain-containing protein, partial [Saprospiraceae bacterium]|nr:T9SS type A sorting domain-containing protein [Saprospiraceae bacterium]
NRPNPFRDQTIIGFSVPEATDATLTVLDVTGKQVKVLEGFVTKGYHEWLVKDLGTHQSGVLYYMLQTDQHSAVRKMVRIE